MSKDADITGVKEITLTIKETKLEESAESPTEASNIHHEKQMHDPHTPSKNITMYKHEDGSISYTDVPDELKELAENIKRRWEDKSVIQVLETNFYKSAQMFIQREDLIEESIKTFNLDAEADEIDGPHDVHDEIIEPLLSDLPDMKIMEKIIDDHYEGRYIVEYNSGDEGIFVKRVSC